MPRSAPSVCKHLILVGLLLLIHNMPQAQITKQDLPHTYTPALQRLLIYSAGNFLFVSSQGQIDLDSAMLMACQIYHLNRLLPYNEGLSNKTTSPGSILINNGKIHEATQLLTQLHDTARIQLALELAAFYIFKPGTEKNDLDNARKLIQQASAWSNTEALSRWKNKSLDLLAQCNIQSGHPEESKKRFEQAAQINSRNGNEAALAQAWLNQAKLLSSTDPSKLDWLKKSLALYHKLQLKEKEIETLTEIITIHFVTDWPTAKKELQQILDLQKAAGFKHLMYTENVMAYLADLFGDFITALAHTEQSLKNAQLTNDTAMISSIYARKGLIYGHLGQHNEAMIWLRKSISYRSRQTQLLWYKAFLNLATWLVFLNKNQEALQLIQEITSEYPPQTAFDQMNVSLQKAYCYDNLHQNKKAEQYYTAFSTIASQFPPQQAFSETVEGWYRMAIFYFNQAQMDKSLAYLRKSESYQFGKSILNIANSSLLHFKLDSATGHYQSALKYFMQYKFYADSMNSLSQHKQVEELLLKYETEKKDHNITTLTQQSKIQQADIQQANFIRNITIGGLALLLVFVALLYNQYRLKQRANKSIHEKNIALQHIVEEKEWLLKEIHHRVKNNLQTIVSLLESQSAYLQDDALLAIQDSQNRVYAMSLIHQKLYLTENVAAINMATYLPELVTHLRQGFNTGQHIRFLLHIVPLEIDVSQAIPLGLILNEAITNAIKYAFTGKEGPHEISISMQQHHNHQVELVIADNGKGLPPNFDSCRTNSLGMKLMRGLTGDINGQFNIDTTSGTKISVIFEPADLFQTSAKETI